MAIFPKPKHPQDTTPYLISLVLKENLLSVVCYFTTIGAESFNFPLLVITSAFTL